MNHSFFVTGGEALGVEENESRKIKFCSGAQSRES